MTTPPAETTFVHMDEQQRWLLVFAAAVGFALSAWLTVVMVFGTFAFSGVDPTEAFDFWRDRLRSLGSRIC